MRLAFHHIQENRIESKKILCYKSCFNSHAIDVIYQSRKDTFYHIYKHKEVSKNDTQGEFLTNFEAFRNVVRNSLDSKSKPKPRGKRRLKS